MIRRSVPDRPETLHRVNAKEMRIAVGCIPCPIEQSEVWEAFEQSQGHELFGRYVYRDPDGKSIAAIALYRYEIRGQAFVWAKHGPVWLKEQSPEREAHLRALLRREVARRDRKVVFIRMHARYKDTDTHELISTITYDRTYVIDLRPGTPEKIAAAMPKEGRRGVARAERVARQAGCTISDETGLSRAEFEKVYAVLVATAERDGFSPHPSQVYWDMLTTLGPEHARLFVLRRDGVPHCWVLVTIFGKRSVAVYGASSNESRGFRGSEATDWFVALAMADRGCEGLDLMGADSTRVPELYSVGRYKRRFAQHVTEVDGAWDVPVITPVYRALASARKVQLALRRHRGR